MEQEINAPLRRMMVEIGKARAKAQRSKFISECAMLWSGGIAIINLISACFTSSRFRGIDVFASAAMVGCLWLNSSIWRRTKRQIKNLDDIAKNTAALSDSSPLSTRWEHHMDQLEAALHQKI